MNGLKSIDYARLIQFAAQKFHRQMLNKTQVNKILYCVYGRYLAKTGVRLFDDDTPKAWPYGPVFPIVNKRIDIHEVISFPARQVELFKKDQTAQRIVADAVAELYGYSARALTDWSHQYGSPWYRTVYLDDGSHAPWNTEIPDEYTKEYFTETWLEKK